MVAALTNILNKVSKYSEIVVAFFVVAVVVMIIVPMPPLMLDLLLVLNISLGITILVLTLFTRNVLEFSTFPTMLLVTTMLRLALNISSTRLILSQGYAGEVINAFANFVTGNNYIVGAVIFIIITIVQIVVVTNGSGRVSEVSARFTLDAMPGKQMAIDADLNSGLITEEEAIKRRGDLQREADFYGSMDGASKFVKGDAIAGIIITIINLIGGILIFSINEGLGVMEALEKFGKLAIGDGLSSQIPSLLISVASGIIVTRSEDGNSFGKSVTKELLGVSQVTMIVSIVLIGISLVPAFPTIPFLAIGLIMGVLSYLLIENEKVEKELALEEANMAMVRHKKEETEEVTTIQVEPISLEIGYGLINLVDEGNEDNLINHVTSIRRQCASEFGIIVNPIRIRDNLQLEPNAYQIKIKGNRVASGEIYTDKYMVIDPGVEEFELEGIATKEPSFGLDALWINEEQKDKADLLGYTIVDPVVVLVTHLKEIIKIHSPELLGRQEVKQLLEGIKDRYNVVIDELIPDIMTLGEVQKVLQNLLKENVPIYDLVTILETLADHGTSIKDTEVLTEQVRHALKRTIVKNYLNHEEKLLVVTIHPELEDLIGNHIQKTMGGSMPILDPSIVTKIFDSVKETTEMLLRNGIEPVILASPKVRLAFRNLIAFNFPNIPVLSLNEVPNDIEIEGVGMVDNI